jgi:opacity protein-like surface antigen
MSRNKFAVILMALVAMSFFKTSLAFSQDAPRAFTPQIKTPETNKELKVENFSANEEPPVPSRAQHGPITSSTPRRLQQHGLGLGIGQTFLLGNYSDHGEDKITLDVLYTYAASYSFDLLVNAHMSEHELENEKMRMMGLNGSIKARIIEYDNFSPYFLGGLGFYAPRAKRDNGAGGTQWSQQKITFGLNFGGGVDLRLNENYVVGVLGQMHWPFNMKIENQADLRGYYFKLLITGMYLF